MEMLDKTAFTNELVSLTADKRVLKQELLGRHTTFRVGGAASWFVYVETTQELKAVVALCKQKEVPYFLIGNGSNLLVSDKGFDGVVIRLSGEFEEIIFKDVWNEGICHVTAGAGVLLAKLAISVGRKGFTGLEFSGGIPGTVGGGVLMNAGAYGGEIKDTLVGVDVLTAEGEVKHLPASELDLSYRHSKLQETGDIVLKAYFDLKVRQRIQIFAVMESYRKARSAKQPLEFPSAGSTFKRPEGYFAGKLIQDAGLAGYRMGGAAVSAKHCGFVINEEKATAQEVYQLIAYVQQVVKEKFRVELEPEVKFLGEF